MIFYLAPVGEESGGVSFSGDTPPGIVGARKLAVNLRKDGKDSKDRLPGTGD
jgi:hypothetical protein